MRVICGAAKGRRLVAFKGRTIRPTSDKVREAIFDILHGYFPFDRTLDIFAGTGAMGIEAMSRGVKEAAFIDVDRRAASLIKENLQRTGFSAQARIVPMDAIDGIKFLAARGDRFDLVFIDPPYDKLLTDRVFAAIEERELLLPGGVIVSESSKKFEVCVTPARLERFKEKVYGSTRVSFYASPEEE
ncbi:MAG: 16S rRNA (guanine(966)-N(2))-methyltransferase RsmD [Thermodesulfobacteriota bacterium]